MPTTKTGTKSTFWLDPEIFTETTEIDVDIVATRFREMAFLNKGLKIILHDEKDTGKMKLSTMKEVSQVMLLS